MPINSLPNRHSGLDVNTQDYKDARKNVNKTEETRRDSKKSGKTPQIISVKGLIMNDDDKTEYKVVEMENLHGNAKDIEDAREKGQLDPLTESNNSKNRKNDDEIIENISEEKSAPENKESEKNGARVGKSGKDEKDETNRSLKANRNSDDSIEVIETVDDAETRINNNNEEKSAGAEGRVDEETNVPKKESETKKTHDVITVAGKDDVDAASTYSLFMEKDFRYYFQHPYCRVFIAYFVVFCNFLIYAEDPVAHSRKECLIPMIGNDFAFIGTRYPPNAWSLLKVLFWLTGLIVGMIVGKWLIHHLLFNKVLRLKMFTDDQGSWLIMFLVSLITVFIMSQFYNLFLLIGGDSTKPYRISDLMGVSNDIFMKVAACGTWCGDFFTAWMTVYPPCDKYKQAQSDDDATVAHQTVTVTDIMLQEKLYPGWARPVRNWWKKGYNRIILFWIVVLITSFVVVFVIATDYIQWDKLNRDFLPTNELSRAFLASFILVMDLLIVMQDWDFPHFMGGIDIKLPGLNTAHIRFQIPIPRWLNKEHFKIHITGKWFNYGILFLVMLLDLNMWKNQIFYQPYDYGQYIGPEDRIYTVQDDYSLENFNKTQTSYAYRSTNVNPDTNRTYASDDTHMNTKYFEYAIGLKIIAFFPSIIAAIIFGVLIWMFGRFRPTEHDPYAGRLKKRIKKRFSFLRWRRKEEIRRKIHAVPKLLYFTRKATGEKEATEIPSEGFSSDKDENKEEKIQEIA